MHSAEFPDATLVLVGHGSTQNPASARPVLRHAAKLRERRLFHAVIESFYLQDPPLSSLWERVSTPRVFVVPVCISEGYFTTQTIPESLGLKAVGAPSFPRRQQLHGRAVVYCDPVGTHPDMTGALLARALDALTHAPGDPPALPATTTLFVAGHGTPRHDQSRQPVDQNVRQLLERRLFADVRPAFMEEPPRIQDCPASSPTRDLVVVPFFISDGLHTLEDIPVLLGADASAVRHRLASRQAPWSNPTLLAGRRIWYTAAVGTEPFVADIILQRVREAAAPA